MARVYPIATMDVAPMHLNQREMNSEMDYGRNLADTDESARYGMDSWSVLPSGAA